MTYVVDFGGVHPTVEVLQESLLPWAEAVKRGEFGKSSIVVSTRNQSVRTYVESMALQHALPIFVSFSTTPFEVAEAEPAMALSPTEAETLSAVSALGGSTDAAQLASRLGLRHTAATNRLVGLADKGYLQRKKRSGRSGDLFVDPRLPSHDYSNAAFIGQLQGAVPEREIAWARGVVKRPSRKSRRVRTSY
jgi:hypothetical protein